jgi:hypothetical protein
MSKSTTVACRTPRLGPWAAVAAAPAEGATGNLMHYDATNPVLVGRIQRSKTISLSIYSLKILATAST